MPPIVFPHIVRLLADFLPLISVRGPQQASGNQQPIWMETDKGAWSEIVYCVLQPGEMYADFHSDTQAQSHLLEYSHADRSIRALWGALTLCNLIIPAGPRWVQPLTSSGTYWSEHVSVFMHICLGVKEEETNMFGRATWWSSAATCTPSAIIQIEKSGLPPYNYKQGVVAVICSGINLVQCS